MSTILVKSTSHAPDRVTVLLHTNDLILARERLKQEFIKLQGFGYQMENTGIDEFVSRSIYNRNSYSRYYLIHIGHPV